MKIFIRRAAFFLLTAALCLQGCDGDDPPNPNPTISPDPVDIPYPNQTGCLLKSIIRDDVRELHFFYDKQAYINSTTENDMVVFSQLQTVFKYDDSRKITRQEYYYDYHPDPSITHTLYQYKDGLISLAEHYLGDDRVVYTENFTYDELNRLIRISDTKGNSKSFTYDERGNVIETIQTIESEELRIVYADYDDKLTPLSSATGYHNLYSPGKNNPGSSATYQNGDLVKETTYTYAYNDKNLPTRITENSSDGTTEVTIITYQCS
ncbi:hypothetical protein [Pontibacter burrus]|uniref:YD repeat-containing protein n=1 Tax=Pontibacter burrus TaxID=2704466 RepID=A0A6B3LT98_9BACT|nr:hypothetical protein [Pontibacter burrus]NEM98225.1 hypothetical protein [Pontibacter burrus]